MLKPKFVGIDNLIFRFDDSSDEESEIEDKKEVSAKTKRIKKAEKSKTNRNSTGEYDKKLLKQYQKQFIKDFGIVSFSKDNKVGMRWRLKEEVRIGKGETMCAELDCKSSKSNDCEFVTKGLRTLQTTFEYEESKIIKTAYVKLNLCINCFNKLKKMMKKSM